MPLSFGSKYGVTISLLVKFISFFVLCVRPVCLEKKPQNTPKLPLPPPQKKLKPQTNKQCHKNKKELIEDQISVFTLVNLKTVLYFSLNILEGVINQITEFSIRNLLILQDY